MLTCEHCGQIINPVEPLTEQQRFALGAIEKALKEGRPVPSLRELAVSLNLKSTSGVHRILTALENKKYIKRRPAHRRAITVLRSTGG